MPKIVMTGNPSTDYTPMAEGVYDFEVETFEHKVSKNGNEQTKIVVRVLAGPATEGRKAIYWLNRSPKSVGFVKEFLDACGIDYETELTQTQVGPQETLSWDDDYLTGARFRCQVSHDTYEGKTRERFAKFQRSPLDQPVDAPAAAPAPAPAPVLVAPQPAPVQAAAGDVRRRRPAVVA